MSSGFGRWKMILAGMSAVTLVVAAVLWLSPSSIQAAGSLKEPLSPVVCGIHPVFTGASFREYPGGEWRLGVALRWTCPVDQVGVEAATGTVRLWSHVDDTLEYEMPCRISGRVEPDHPLVQHVAVGWEEQNPVFEWLRNASQSEVSTVFVPDWVGLIESSESEQDQSVDTSHTPRSRGRRGGGMYR